MAILRSAVVAVFALVVAGCGSSSESPADMAAAGDDLAMSLDMATGDLGVTLFCDHLRAALAGGTPSDCAVAYMTKIMSCFHPAGACGSVSNGPGVDECWANGAAFAGSHLLGNLGYQYAMNGRTCATISTDTGGPYSAQFCAATADYDCHPSQATDMAGSGARYVGGTFTCTDGTQLAVGAMFDCPEVKQFLAPACDRTVDAGSCVVP